jgi:hypothetical protein
MGWWQSFKDKMFGGGGDIKKPTANEELVQRYAREGLLNAGNRQAPQSQATQLGAAAQLAGDPQAQIRAQQQEAAGFLQGIMGGQRAGAGELAVNRQVSGALAAQQAASRMARGSNAALAGRNAMRNQMDIGLAGAGQAAQAQMADQQQAVNQLGGILAQTRGADVDFAGQNAQLQQQRMLQQGAFNQQTGLANQDALLRQMGMNDAAITGYLSQLTGMDQAELARRQAAAGDKGMFPGLLTAAGTIIGGIYGGPAGAAAGAKIGGAVGNGVSGAVNNGGNDSDLMKPRY